MQPAITPAVAGHAFGGHRSIDWTTGYDMAEEVDASAFVTGEEIRPLARGYFRV